MAELHCLHLLWIIDDNKKTVTAGVTTSCANLVSLGGMFCALFCITYNPMDLCCITC